MNRRQLLAGALAGATVLAVQQLAFAGVTPSERQRLLDRAFARAKQAAKPLMVLIIPGDFDEERGRRLGIWLNNGEDQDLAPLARVEMACATLEELSDLVPGVDRAEGAWIVLVHPGGAVPTWRSVIVPSISADLQLQPYEDFAADFIKEHGKNPDWGQIQAAHWRHEEAISKGRLDAELHAFRASIGRVLASEGLTGGNTTALAEQAREQWVQTAPAGAHWASSRGCGTTIEPNDGDDPMRMGMASRCGMGHVEAYEARFLHFWATS